MHHSPPPFLTQDKNHLTAISSFQKDIMSTLSIYYYTFVDVMEFKDISNEVITSLATSQFFFDIVCSCTLSYDEGGCGSCGRTTGPEFVSMMGEGMMMFCMVKGFLTQKLAV